MVIFGHNGKIHTHENQGDQGDENQGEPACTERLWGKHMLGEGKDV